MKKYISIIVASLLPWAVSAQLVMTSNFDLVLNGGTQANPTSVVLTNPNPSGITNTGTGTIISENEFNQVAWHIGTNTGTYTVPFGYSTTDNIPVTMDITTAGTGSGVIKFSTYHGSSFDNGLYKPSDVTNVADFGAPDYSVNMVDRFWEVDANTGYTTKPTVDLTFTYIRNGAASEIAVPNYIVERTLIAQRFNSVQAKWDDVLGITNTDATTANTGTVSSGSISPANFFRSWTIANDSNQLNNNGTGIQQISGNSTGIVTWPNPVTQTINIKLEQSGNAAISIVNILGQELAQKNQYVSPVTIITMDVSSLAAGMYFVRINTETSTITSKFIKQ